MATTEQIVAKMSPSKHDLLMRCHFAFACRYVEGIKSPPNAALAFGRAFDTMANSQATDKLLNDQQQPRPEVAAEYFDAAWSLERDAVADWPDDDPGTLLDKGTALSARWSSRFLRQVLPRQTQPRLEVEVEVEPGDTFRAFGYADLVCDLDLPTFQGRSAIVDNKASRSRWPLDRFQSSTQAAFYVEAIRRRGGPVAELDTAVWVVGIHGRKTPDLQVLSRRVDTHERDGILRRFAGARSLIRALATSGTWLPNRSNHLCSRRWCAYWSRCERAFGGRVKD